MTSVLPVEELPCFTGSAILDPWRRRVRGMDPAAPTSRPSGLPTQSESILWEALAATGAGWVREHSTGRYRLDFFLPAARLAVEVDGASHWGVTGLRRDVQRDEWHMERGIRTVRVSAHEVEHDLPSVLEQIDREVLARELEGSVTMQAVGHVDAPNARGPRDEVVSLSHAAAEVEAAIVRLARACETVLPGWPAGRAARLRALLRVTG